MSHIFTMSRSQSSDHCVFVFSVSVFLNQNYLSPFHGKRKSNNAAVIIYSLNTLQYYKPGVLRRWKGY
jgi:hypothetical protein